MAEERKAMRVNLPDCAGVTDGAGRHYAADKKTGEVEVPKSTAKWLEAGGALKKPSKSFGGFDFPWMQEKLNVAKESN